MRKTKYEKFIDDLQSIINKLNKLEADMNDFIDLQSITDKEISDYLHLIELEDNVKSPSTIIKKIRSLRRKRTEIRIVKALLYKYNKLQLKMGNKENRAMLMAELHKELKQQQSEYKYRVLGGVNDETYDKSTDDEQAE